MHDLVPEENGVHRVVFFNPAKNFNQVSVLWLVKTGDADAEATITGVGDEGAMPGTAVRVTVPAGSSRKLTSAELESGEADAIDSGALGDGDGKWCLRVASDMPILVVEHTCNDVSARFVGAPFGWSPVRPSPRCAHSTHPYRIRQSYNSAIRPFDLLCSMSRG